MDSKSEEYAKAPLWARKQADKYLQLMSQTKYMTYKETVEYLKRLKETNSDLAVSYVALFKKNMKHSLNVEIDVISAKLN